MPTVTTISARLLQPTANELHAAGDLFAKQIEPQPPDDPVEWAVAEAPDDEDDAPAPPKPELIDMPPAPASAPPMSNLERCIACAWCAALDRVEPQNKMRTISHRLSVVSLVGCPVFPAHARVSTS